ncbi:hypothetical protein [Sphingomonas sp. dw_22]|uniref:hypothetical protein n=1 Tax=Sphingomonas sp. dw_22 TaxID=2721175 RepID=UPI001BD58986|nr:hypothetical protein [Sphingomonas sp. dw_22]
MKPPATRYRVVEKGRRLVVIDTLTGAPVSEHGDGTLPAQPVRRSPAGVDDGSVFITRAWYDEKAPRTVRLNYATRQRIKNIRFAIALAAAIFVVLLFLFWPFSLILFAVPLVQPKLHKQARGAVTRWIDGFDQAA